MSRKDGTRKGMRRSRSSHFLLASFFVLLTIPLIASETAASTYKVDLGHVAEQRAVRYYFSEYQTLPPRYILLGDIAIYPNFLSFESDLRKNIREYDPNTGMIFQYRVPGDFRFASVEEREGPFFKKKVRDTAIPGMDIKPVSIDDITRKISMDTRRKVWISEVRYNLERDREAKRGGGLIDLNIPINLPKQIEWLIGDGEETRLTVSGREKITIGGTSKWCANCPVTEGRPKQQKFPDLDMEQQLSVNLHGNIGEKIHVNIDHSSVGQGMGSTNRVHLNYEGFEDEIIKSIEMGDTDLTLSGAQLISYSGAAKGLFGIKVKAQLGLADLTIIASKEEGETASGSFSGTGGQSSQVSISDYNYIKRQYFYFETPGESFDDPEPGFISHPTTRYFPVYGGDNNDEIEVFRSLTFQEQQNYQGGAKFKLIACVDPENDGVDGTEEDRYEDVYYELLKENEDYTLIELISSGGTKLLMGIRLNQPLPAERSLAVRYRCDNGTPYDSDNPASLDDDFFVGDYKDFEGDPETREYLAELICPEEDDASDPYIDANSPTRGPFWSTWHMMFRNIYSLGSAGLEDGEIKVSIENVSTIIGTKDIQKETEISYLRIFGLDQENTEGIRVPDGLIDNKKGILNFYYGYIMFPYFEPFNVPRDELASYLSAEDVNNDGYGDPTQADYNQADTVLAYLDPNSVIYKDYVNDGVNNPTHYYDIIIEATSGSRTFQLNAFDIIEGTEVVMVDGEKLSRGTDYEIDYIGGNVTLKGDRLLTMSPDSKVSIDYQHKPLVGGGKTSLLGVGANLNLSTNSRLNASFLYNSVGTPRYNPRLGDEPTRNMAGDVNGSFQFYPRWMTSLANLLPRVDTDVQSTLSVSGEVAVSIPNPNTKGEAFVDDMEGIEDSNQLVLVRSMWYEASPPIDPLNNSMTLDPMPEDFDFYWYNPVRESTSPQFKLTTSKRDLNPRLDSRENSAISSLFLKTFDPQPGEWMGVMTGFPGGLDISTAQYLEIWVNDYNLDPEARGGIIHIDLGRIDEDFYQADRDSLNDERRVDWTIEDDDGFIGEEGGVRYPTAFDGSTYIPEKGVYRGINSRNGNNQRDSEDLNRNSRFDERNEYYSLTLDLADTAIIDVQRDFSWNEYSDYWNDRSKTEEYGGPQYEINKKKSWRMYRLDLSKASLPGGIAPRLDAIQHMRIWVENPDALKAEAEYDGPEENMVEIAAMKFVGSRWEFDQIRDLEDETQIIPTPDMKVKIGTINNKDNPSIYYSPYNVEVEDGLENREQSLLIEVENFERERSFRLMKRFLGGGQDFQQYRELEFFVRGDQDLTSHQGDLVDFYLQFAYDSLNYYELVVPLTPERAGLWNLVKFKLSDLTDMKLGAEAGQDVERMIQDTADPDKSYPARLHGNPSFFQIRYLYAGLRNRSGVMIQQGQVWFNDIVLDEVRKDIDHAERMSFSANFGNILSLSGSYQHTGPEFRSLRQKKGSGVTSDSYALSGKTELNHIVPTGGFQLPVSLRYSKSKSKPKYLPQKDVEITDPAVQDSLKTVKNSYSMSISLSRRGSKNFIMKNLFDNLKAGFNYSKNSSFSPTAKDTSWTVSGNANYQIQFNKDRQIKLFKGMKWRYWLTNFAIKTNGSRSIKRGYTFSGDEFVKRPVGYSCGWDNEITSTYDPFESLKFSYRRGEKRNLALENKVLGVDMGVLTEYRQSLDMNYQPRNVFFISQFNPRFEYRSSYEENLKPGVRQGGDPEGTRDVVSDRDISIVFDLDVGKYALNLGKLMRIIGKDEQTSSSKLLNQRTSLMKRKSDFEEMMKKKMTTKGEDKPEGILQIQPEPENASKPVQPAEQQNVAEDEGAKKPFSNLALDRPRTENQNRESVVPADSSLADSTAADSTGVKGGGRKSADPMLLFKHLFRFIGRVDPIKSSLNIDRRNTYDRLYDRADLMYQLGLTSSSGTDGAFTEAGGGPLRQSSRLSLDLRTGFNITSNISANLNYNFSKRTEESDTRTTESDDTTWPDVNINWRGLQNWALLRRFIKQSDLTISYIQRTSRREGEETKGFQLNPNWNLTWKNSLSSNVSVSYAKKTIFERNQEMWEKTWSVNVEMKYDIKGTKGIGLPIPFLNKKKLKFESTLTTVLNVMYSRAEKYNIPSTSSLSVSPRFTYTFSRNVSGNLSMTYRRTAGGIYGYINHEVGLHATAEFKF